MRPVLLVLAAAALAPSSVARAQVTLDYQAAAGCPDRGEFLGAADRKAAGWATGYRGAALRVELQATPAGFTGTLQSRTRDPRAPIAERVLSAARCDELVEALALTLALSLVPAEPAAVAAVPASPPPAPATAPGRPLVATVGLGGHVGGFVDSGPMLGPGLSVSLGRGPGEGSGWWALSLEGHLRLSWGRSDLLAGEERARFQLLAAAASLCPLHAGVGPVRAGLCGLVQGGTLRGQGVAIEHPRTESAGWLAVGGETVFRLALSRRWGLAGVAQVTRALRRTRFVFTEPGQPLPSPVARTVDLAWSVGLAAEVHFP